ncbi:hypothetical protein XELAEV_18005825mg [Xenopus laevis]|uniref:Ubiquitin carboxyl-terminal hydrolase n=1 Tax=Xenopus laevis TaxID=8355 RepID=A0A974DYC3_XENLA|nr:hypothetical protein XELAEV_18005825mg [Xenopus laevis]
MNNIKQPEKILFSNEKIFMKWRNAWPIGAGLRNLGNTCYMNSVLQCLTYTAPLANYLLTREHSKTCAQRGFCMMCVMQNHVTEVLGHPEGVIKPLPIYNELHNIAGHFIQGRQEDAHEFLRYAVDALQQACLRDYDSQDMSTKATSLIHRVFGGYLRSQVMCLNCFGESNTFDKFMDIQLDIKNSNSITEALKEYVKSEELGENCYKCSKCNEMVTATKTLSIKRPSNVLTLSLNRFDVFSENKISKMVAYPEFIDIQPYTSEPNGEPITYRLYAVLVHAGNTCNSGHYYCYVKQIPQKTDVKRKEILVQDKKEEKGGKGLKRPFADITSSKTPSTFSTASSSPQKPTNSQPEGIKRIKLDRSLLFKVDMYVANKSFFNYCRHQGADSSSSSEGFELKKLRISKFFLGYFDHRMGYFDLRLRLRLRIEGFEVKIVRLFGHSIVEVLSL